MNQQLKFENISVRAERLLVENVSLTVKRGRVLALVGGSGSGKSMTCSAALEVLPPGVKCIDGQITLDGQRAEGKFLRGRQIATIMQNPRSAFNPLHTMRAHIQETCNALAKECSESVIIQTLKDVGLENARAILRLHSFEMSGGMLQRMMIALAVLSDAPYLFADEPTTDLDMPAQARILDLLEQLIQQRGLGMLLVTHDMGVVARLADDVAVMHCGKIIEQGAVDDLFYRPLHPMTRQLVAAHLSLYGLEPTP